MPAKVGRPFRSFTLLELSHLTAGEFKSNKQAVTLLKQRLEFGKRIIDAETKTGDLVLLETPTRYTFDDYKKTVGEEATERYWKNIGEFNSNFYFLLAEYAKSKGREVASIDSGIVSPGSRLERQLRLGETQAILTGPEFKHFKRVEFLAYYKRNIFMGRRIQTRKPKLVIVAGAHAIYLENTLKPKKVIYNNQRWNEPFRKTNYLEQHQQETQYFLRQKRLRRKSIAKQKSLKMKKQWKPRI